MLLLANNFFSKNLRTTLKKYRQFNSYTHTLVPNPPDEASNKVYLQVSVYVRVPSRMKMFEGKLQYYSACQPCKTCSYLILMYKNIVSMGRVAGFSGLCMIAGQ